MKSAFGSLLALAALCVTLAAPSAIAGPLGGSTATIATDVGGTTTVGSGPCKSGDAVSVVGAGVELGAANYTGRCFGLVAVDVSDNQFVVTGLRESGVGDYRWMTLVMDFAGAGPITGVLLVSQGLFRGDADDPAPSISFDADTISVTWDSTASGPSIFKLQTDGSAVFSVTTRGTVPEPASTALVGLGLAAFGLRRRHAAR